MGSHDAEYRREQPQGVAPMPWSWPDGWTPDAVTKCLNRATGELVAMRCPHAEAMAGRFLRQLAVGKARPWSECRNRYCFERRPVTDLALWAESHNNRALAEHV